jgi:hypothetical protein
VAVEALPPDVTHVPTGWASNATGEVQAPAKRPVRAGDVRTRCDHCPAYVDGEAEAGQVWLRSHEGHAHGGSL